MYYARVIKRGEVADFQSDLPAYSPEQVSRL
jgi:hypothetical protein